MTIVKGGPAANALCRGLDSEWGRKLVGKTLIRNIAQSIYQNRKNLEKGVRQVGPSLLMVLYLESNAS